MFNKKFLKSVLLVYIAIFIWGVILILLIWIVFFKTQPIESNIPEVIITPSPLAPQDIPISFSQSDSTNKENRLYVENNKIKLNSKDFFIRGNQYLHIDSQSYPAHGAFLDREFDLTSIQESFKKMKELNYNTVRLVFNPHNDSEYKTEDYAKCTNTAAYVITDCISEKSLNNFVITLNEAKKNDLKVILTFTSGSPFQYYSSSSEPYDGPNINFLKEETLQDYGRFLFDFFTYIKSKLNNDLSAIGMVEPFGEPSLDGEKYPFTQSGLTLTYPEFYVPSGKSYTVNSSLLTKVNGQSSEAMKEILNFSIINAFNYWAEQIRRVDSNILLMHDQFPTFAIKNEVARHVSDFTLTSSSLKADIISMQFYPEYMQAQETIDDILNFTPGFKETLNIKPFFVIEYGISKKNFKVEESIQYLKDLLIKACSYNIQGWNFFNWGEQNFDYMTSEDNNYQLAEAFSPINFSNCRYED